MALLSLAVAVAQGCNTLAQAVRDHGEGLAGFWAMGNKDPVLVELDEVLAEYRMDHAGEGELVLESQLELDLS